MSIRKPVSSPGLYVAALIACGFAPSGASAFAGQDAAVNADASRSASLAESGTSGDGNAAFEVVTRGPLHEAFARPFMKDPVESPVINAMPPEALDEKPPQQRLSGDNVVWLPGYWDYDPADEDFLWISGLWRRTPPGRQWVPGYWTERDDGYTRISGAWVAADAETVSYVPKPPASQERGPNSPAPSKSHFWVPGQWVYENDDYRWQPGYWAASQANWTWVPASFQAAANGYLQTGNYWDYSANQRGALFAPVRLQSQTNAAASIPFVPSTLLSSDFQLLIHLFVNSNLGNYFFGDYYSDSFLNAGFSPVTTYAGASGGLDPLLAQYDAQFASRRYSYSERIAGWQQYFLNHPDYRPAATLVAQQAFAAENSDFQHLNRVTLGVSLDDAIRGAASASQFVNTSSSELQNFVDVAGQLNALANQRLEAEGLDMRAAASTSADANVDTALPSLSLPNLPVFRSTTTARGAAVLPQVPQRNVDATNVQRNLPRPRVNVPSPRSVPSVPGLPL